MHSKDSKALLSAALWIGFVLYMTLLGILFSKPLPSGVHTWAQSDRYALAKQYIDYSVAQTPRTYSLMSEDGKVGVEFPVLPALSSLLAHVLGEQQLPWIMRSLNLIILLISLIYLARCTSVKNKLTTSLAIVTMVLSPVLVFYAFNFLPDSTGLALVIFSFSQLILFQKEKTQRNWILVILLAGLATLVKTSCGIFLLSFTAAIGLHFILKSDWKSLLRLFAVFLLTTAVIVSYDYLFFYKVNTSLYAIIFMSENQPITNFEELTAFFKALRFWFGQWITLPQVIALAVIILATIFAKKTSTKNSNEPFGITASAVVISLIG